MDDNLKFWQRTARLYTAMQEKSNRALYAAVMDRCRPYLTKDSRVLELACGTGQFTQPLCGLVKAWEATDFSPEMIRRAKPCPGARFSVEDATDLSFPDRSFDLVLMANALHIMPRPQKALEEIRRVLVPGGMLLVPTFVYEGKRNRLRLWVLEKVGFRTFHKWTVASLAAFLEEAGFQVIEQALIPGKLLPEGFLAAKTTE